MLAGNAAVEKPQRRGVKSPEVGSTSQRRQQKGPYRFSPPDLRDSEPLLPSEPSPRLACLFHTCEEADGGCHKILLPDPWEELGCKGHQDEGGEERQDHRRQQEDTAKDDVHCRGTAGWAGHPDP